MGPNKITSEIDNIVKQIIQKYYPFFFLIFKREIAENLNDLFIFLWMSRKFPFSCGGLNVSRMKTPLFSQRSNEDLNSLFLRLDFAVSIFLNLPALFNSSLKRSLSRYKFSTSYFLFLHLLSFPALIP